MFFLHEGRTDIRGFVPSELQHLRKLGENYSSSLFVKFIFPHTSNYSIRIRQQEYLDLGENNLHGTIPNQLSRLNQLQVLYLGDNEITGSIPPELGNLVSLE